MQSWLNFIYQTSHVTYLLLANIFNSPSFVKAYHDQTYRYIGVEQHNLIIVTRNAGPLCDPFQYVKSIASLNSSQCNGFFFLSATGVGWCPLAQFSRTPTKFSAGPIPNCETEYSRLISLNLEVSSPAPQGDPWRIMMPLAASILVYAKVQVIY